MQQHKLKSRRRWWLNPPLLATIFVFAAIVIAISGSLDERPTRQSGNHYWETFIERPALPLEDAAILGTWRRDVQLSAPSTETVHCGLRSYGLKEEARERFLANVANGRAEGWAPADPNDALPDLISGNTPCRPESDPFMRGVLDTISAAWDNRQNPRFRRASAAQGMVMRGVFDDRSGQV
ncbi:MAG: hypothetical protein ACX939_12740, partial [Hyphococcus sp.]